MQRIALSDGRSFTVRELLDMDDDDYDRMLDELDDRDVDRINDALIEHLHETETNAGK